MNIENKIFNLKNVIEKDDSLRERDKDILSVSLKKLEKDVIEYKTTEQSYYYNKHDSMITYYEDKLMNQENNLERNYEIVLDLYRVAQEKGISLLRYITYERGEK